jgi:phosphoribosylformylglycinamidine synthase
MDKGLITGIQDMGAAGLTCSTSEMAAKSGTGIAIDLDLVPQREEGMTPYEIMLSESQERMLIVCRIESLEEVRKVFAKWDLDAVRIGEVTETKRLQVGFRGERVVDIPVDAIVNLCPAYRRPSHKPGQIRSVDRVEFPPPPDEHNRILLSLLSLPTIADKEWVFRQYDHMVQSNTVLLPGADAAVLRLKGQKHALAITLDGNSLYAFLDPGQGGRIAVAEACRNLACVGARPVGVTNCLNFGNPEKPEVMWQFKEVIAGMAEACRAFAIPVTGGNVSFYNDTEGASVYPTPVLGIVGIVDDVNHVVGPGFRNEGDIVVLLGENTDELGGSEYLRTVFSLEQGPPPGIDLEMEKRVQQTCLEAISRGLVRSAHDLSEGGLAVCAAECALLSPGHLGCELDLGDRIRPDALLFGEGQSRIVVSLHPSKLSALLRLARKNRVRAKAIGPVRGRAIIIRQRSREIIHISVLRLYQAWKSTIPRAFAIR